MKAIGQIARMAMAPLLVGVFACVATAATTTTTSTTHLNANELESSNKLTATEFLLQDGIYWPKLKRQDELPIVQARNQSSATPTSRRSRRHNHQHAHHHHNNQGNQQNYKTTYACEGNQMELNCQEGKLIHLVRAIYGRFSLTICNELGHSNYSVQCASFRAFLFMENRCNKLSNCSVTVSKELFGDPCEGTSKYLEVQYFCDDATTQVNGTAAAAAHNKQSGSSVISNPNNRTAAPSNGHKSPTESQDSSSMDPQQASATMTRTTSGHNSPADLDSRTSSPVPVIPVQQQQLFCPPQISSRNLYWNATRAGQVARQSCPEGANGRVAWTCDFERLRFAPSLGPDFSQCKSIWLTRLSLQLDQLLETPLISNSGSSRETIQNQDEQMIKSILGELSLMANSKELFSEDLKRIDVMLSQMNNQLRSLAVLFGGAASSSISIAQQSPRDDGQPWAAPLQQLRNPLIVRMQQELFQKLVTISSSLFDLSQRNAWLELPNADARRRLETRLLSHLKEAGLMLAQSLPADQLAEMAPVRRANIHAGFSVLSNSLSASLSVDGSTGELNLQSGKSSLAYLNRLFGATSDQDEQQQQPQIATEWRLQATLLKELASNGINKFLLLDVKKPDFSLIRQQLEVQQQQQVSEQLATTTNNNNNNNNNNFLVADNTNQAFNLAGDQTQYQSRIFGIFPVIGDTGELAVELDNKPELSRLAESLSKWPISVEFKLSSLPGASQSSMTSSTSAPVGAYLANQRHCQSLSDNSNSVPSMDFSSSPTNRCHLSRYNATNFICSCDKFGFLLLGQQFLTAAATGPVGPMLQNDAWPSSPAYDSDTLLDNTRTYDSYVVNKNQQAQQQQQQQSIGILAGIMIVLGVALLILTVGGLVVSVAFRLSNGGSKQANKKQSYFDGTTTTTTGPLTDHNLMGSDPLVSNAATTHSASIIGLNGAGQYAGSNAPSVGYKPHQLYSHQQAAPMMEAYASGPRSHAAWPLRALNWLLARPVEWLSEQLTGSDRQDGVHQFPPMGKSSSAAAVDHMSIQHRLIGGAATSTTAGAVGTLGYHHQHQKAANQYQNGYTTALHQRAAVSSTGSQSAVPLNGASSNSSYVSSSAYYEEIGPGALTKVSTSHTIVDPFKRHLHEQQQQQQQFQHWQAPQQQHHNTHTISYSMMEPTNQQQQQQQISLITKQHLHTDLSPLQSSSSASSANSTHQQQQHATTPRHYLFASPSAVSAYKQQQQQQFRTNTNGFLHAGNEQ